jgi:diguanylate cyclase (GGDEF)-like protein
VPLFSLEQVVAVFSVRFTDGVSSHSEEIRRARLSEFAAMGQSISGALSTIALRESLQREALSDVLTGLPNRRAFQAEARNMIARCRRTDRQFSVGIIDIDHFKRINDELGHAEGDVVLKHLASQLEQHFRDGDLCARLGGEEFGVLMTDCEVESSHSRLSSLLDRVRTRCRIGERLVTISIGFIHSTGITGETDLDDMLNLADKALYLAKEGGRDRVEQGEE